MPPEPTRVHLQGQHAVCVKIVAEAVSAVKVGTRISGGPIEQIQFRIKRPCQPGRPATVLNGTALPGFRAWLTWRRNRPKPPEPFSRLEVISVQEPSCALISSGGTHDHFVLNHQWRHRPPITLVVVCNLRFPDQASILGMQS